MEWLEPASAWHYVYVLAIPAILGYALLRVWLNRRNDP